MSLFEINDIKEEIQTSYMPKDNLLSEKYKGRTLSKKFLRKEKAFEIFEKIGGVPKQGESVDILCNGQSNAGGFYEVLRDQWEAIECMCIATWIINRDYIDLLFADVESGKIKKLIFVISNRMSQLGKGHSPNFNVMKQKFTSNPNISFKVVNSHAKTYCLTDGNDYITVDGSGNWSENPRLETYTITNSKKKYDFREQWMSELCNSK